MSALYAKEPIYPVGYCGQSLSDMLSINKVLHYVVGLSPAFVLCKRNDKLRCDAK